MTATGRGGGFGRSAGDAALRGALLVAAAVILGALLIWKGPGRNSDAAETIVAGASTTNKPTTTKKGGAAPTTVAPTTTVAIRSKPSVKVLVANGVGAPKPSYAGSVRTKLVASTWAVQGAINAKVGQQATHIFYVEGYLNEAKELAKDLGVTVAPTLVPVDLTPYLDQNGMNMASAVNIVVILGLDGVVQA